MNDDHLHSILFTSMLRSVVLPGRMELSEQDLNLIFNKYKKNGAFNYYVSPARRFAFGDFADYS